MTKKRKNKKKNTGFHPLYDADLEFEELENSQIVSPKIKKGLQKPVVDNGISVCLTVLNEELGIGRLIESLQKQTSSPKEIIIVDGGSIDQTVNIIKHYKRTDKRIVLISKKTTRAEARNLGVGLSNGNIIAMTDAGCVAEKDWLEKITEPFKDREVEVVAGFYDMVGTKPLQKAFAVYMGTTPGNFDNNFLPSTRSLAFRKTLWKKVGGFPEIMRDTAEDTLFNFNIIRLGLKFTLARKARVAWLMPDNLGEGLSKIYKYALGDAVSGIWIHPSKGLITHNVKVIFKIIRYFIGFTLLFLGLSYPLILNILLLLFFAYTLNASMKVYKVYEDISASLWGILLQFLTDFASISGFMEGSKQKMFRQ